MKANHEKKSRAPCATFARVLGAALALAVAWSALSSADPRREGEDPGGGGRDGFNTPVVFGPNLVSNPSFATGHAGWVAYGGCSLGCMPEGVTGPHSVEMVGPASMTEFGIDDAPGWVPVVPAAGTRYRLSAWVWGDNSPGNATIRVREWLAGTPVGLATSDPVALDLSWQKVEMDYVAQRAGSALDIQILNMPTCMCEGFHIDAISIQQVLTKDLPPVLTVPATVFVRPGQPLTLDVAATDPDGPAIGYLSADVSQFPAGNRPVFQTNSDLSIGRVTWTPTAADVRDAPYPVSFTAANSGVRTTTANVVVTNLPHNFVLNEGFETNLGGWRQYGGATLVRVPYYKQGAWAVEVRGPAQHVGSFGIDDFPQWIYPTVAKDAVYNFSAWVRSESSAGKVRFRICEYRQDGALVGATAYSGETQLTPAWQLIAFTFIAREAGTNVCMRITDTPVAKGETFQVDKVEITLVSAGGGGIEPPGGKKGTGSLAQTIPDGAMTLAVPNPARGTATMTVTLTRPGPLRIDVYDIGGRTVRTLADGGTFAAGTHAFELNGTGAPRLPSGMYFYRACSALGDRHGRFVIVE